MDQDNFKRDTQRRRELTGGAADEVEFGQDREIPDFAADEVKFGRDFEASDDADRTRGHPGAPNYMDAVELEEEGGLENRRHENNEDVETAAEVAPVAEPVRNERDRKVEENREGSQEGGTGLATVGIILSVLSFFFVPFLLGSAGIVLGLISGRRGSTLGWWAVGLGALSVILTAFVAPIAGF
ncbi:hypothetical protein SAMN04488112_10137 [Melghirimyces thermohalophilus]|uniref:DUF4190 domain-containing protein n=1 Tax=Melghirimyces thermohalophilus TaxID=1236220 RepID=A0A1G6HLP2_9BACL|nr:hypothetical protein [Melghirimyces thermohalophilus]SDB94805.1 hypothetical protein SAMN04488112_10137 [Melghirimyces thermohalophilus]